MITLDSLKFIGQGLQRPECVLCTRAGFVYVSDWRGGVTRIDPKGYQESFLAQDSDFEVRPNGIALLSDGSFLLAHLGAEQGGVYRLERSGELTPFLTEIEDTPLPPTNFVHLDLQGRVWVTVSTRIKPRSDAYRPNISDGFIVLVHNGQARIVADGLGYTNECVVDPSGEWLYVNETFTRQLSRFPILLNGSLGEKEVIAHFGAGVFPDGLAFDCEGGIWVVSIVSNRVIRLSLNGEQAIVLEDSNPNHVAWVEDAFQSHCMGRPHLDQVKSHYLKNISSLAFGGVNQKTVYLGCLLDERIAVFHSTIPGVSPVHWHFDD